MVYHIMCGYVTCVPECRGSLFVFAFDTLKMVAEATETYPSVLLYSKLLYIQLMCICSFAISHKDQREFQEEIRLFVYLS
jgi:hypothetical protein